MSLPQTTFAPYTPTKTSIVFGQKKTREAVEAWNASWRRHSNEYARLKTRVENYTSVYILGEAESKYPSVKGHSESKAISILSTFLGREFDVNEKIGVKAALLKYKRALDSSLEVDRDIAGEVGYVNATWVFRKVANELDVRFLCAEIENVGFKRSKRGERSQPNDLFDKEIAPQTIDLTAVATAYRTELDELQKQIDAGQRELATIKAKGAAKSKADERTEVALTEKLAGASGERQALDEEWSAISVGLSALYDASGALLPHHGERLDKAALAMFSLPRMALWRSENVLVRKTTAITVLDHMRRQGLWQ